MKTTTKAQAIAVMMKNDPRMTLEEARKEFAIFGFKYINVK